MASLASTAHPPLPRGGSAPLHSGTAGSAFTALAVAAWLVPPLYALGQAYWSTAQGAQGPIVLATGCWALRWELSQRRGMWTRGRTVPAITLLAGAVMAYVVGRMAGALTLECLAAYAGIIVLLYHRVGGRALRAAWVPLVYLLCLVPPPFVLALALTRALKLALSEWAVTLLDRIGLPVAFSGTALYVDQYEVVLEAACSGLNSLFSLTAVGFFYIFWQRRGDWAWGAALMLLVVPLAIFANLIRVMLLLALVHFRGPAVLDGLLHPAAGFAMFFIALGILVLVDWSWRRLHGQRGLR